MTTPANPLRLQIIDRIVAVLKAIAAGAEYFYTPKVEKRFVHWAEAKYFPTYMVFPGSGGHIEIESTQNYDEDMIVSIKGIVKDSVDPGSVIEKCLCDIRRAIDIDSRSGAVGTLGALAVETAFEEGPTTDDGYLSLEGFGFFDQPLRVKIGLGSNYGNP
jgi:hypothetical protein